jgi:hypothetical protein
MQPGAYYRIDRHDVRRPIAARSGWHETLAACERGVFAVHAAEGSFARRPGSRAAQAAAPRPLPAPLHTNASGDFFLMARDNWHDLRGYTELTTHAHIDSIMCWTAVTAGLQEVVLGGRMRLYHQDHDRSLHAGFPLTDWVDWRRRYWEAIAAGRRLVVNGEDWGLKNDSLQEYIL